MDQILDRGATSRETLEDARSALVARVERQRAERADKVEHLVAARKAQQAAVEALRGERAGTAHPTTATVRADADGWRRVLARVARLEVDDVLVRDAATPRARPAILAWIADDAETYLLVDRAGGQAEYLTRQEIGVGLHRGTLTADASAKLPAVERNLYRMLHGLHRKLEREAARDPVTGLLNRKQLGARLRAAVDAAGSVTSFLCLLAIDDFEALVERCGRRAGETLRVKLARVLEKQVGAAGLVSRLDRERFAILFPGGERREVAELIERQRRSVEQSLCYHNGRSFGFRLSFGLTEISGNARTPAAVLKAAKDALAAAREAGGNRLQWHARPARDERGARAATGPRSTVADLIERDGLGLRCQRVEPISVQVGALPYYEVLLGVKGPRGRLDPPGKVIADAESQGDIETLDYWVIRTTFTWMAQDPVRMEHVSGYAINLSGVTLSREHLLGYVLEQLTEHRVPPGKVIFEVTETAGIDRLSVARHFVTALRDHGCRFSLDDFGAGHASLAYLKQLPVDNVKIDGLFVKDMMKNEADHAMVKSINDIAHFMGRKTVAEFVEDESIVNGLRELGVDYAQGYGVERPLPVAELAERWQGARDARR